ncbi:MAG TPA: aminotransferase class V-fold PLP-dependent enzyme, partial [Longimicrobiales bacterium]|nr:aminotransferase class V-fold PLP-dependent enzyme [Longimicrobiales bacterium]
MSWDPFFRSEPARRSLDRRSFLRFGLGATALSLAAAEELNAAVYDSVAGLNRTLLDQESPDGAYWKALRKHYLFEDDLIMMNHGTVGPMPEPVFNTLTSTFKIPCTAPCEVYNPIGARKDEVRAKVARFLGADTGEVVLTHNTTEGLSFVADGLDPQSGDEVLLSSMEHMTGIAATSLLAKRRGVVVKEVAVGLPPRSVDEIVGAFEAAITPRTKVILMSHTVYISGLISPIKELSEMAHRHDVLVLADSAHGPGMLDMNLHDTGVDFWAGSPYKWLGAPCGIGVFYVRKDVQERLWPTIAMSGWDTQPDARRFETLGQQADPLAFALGEAVDLQNTVGKARIQRRIQTLAKHLKGGLAEIPKVRLHTSMDPY